MLHTAVVRTYLTTLALCFALLLSGACGGDAAPATPPTSALPPGVLPVEAAAISAQTWHGDLASGESRQSSTDGLGLVGSSGITTRLGTPVIPTCERLVLAYRWEAIPADAARDLQVTIRPGEESQEEYTGATGYGIIYGCAPIIIQNHASTNVQFQFKATAGVLAR